MVRDISSINILFDLNNHLENSKHLFKNSVSNRIGWSIADFNGKMRLPIKPRKTNFNMYTMAEMEISLSVSKIEVIPALVARCNEWDEHLMKHNFSMHKIL